ncbi:MAG: peroxidase family protein, partial [Bacteroidota bacterium]
MSRLLLFAACLLSGLTLVAQVTDIQNYRTIDGTYNNLQDIDLGAAHTELRQVTSLGFADGYSAVGGTDRPNPRDISNALFAQDDDIINDPTGLSAFTWVWGQFIDHDLGLTEHPGAPLMIPVPAGDEHLDPFGTGEMMIPMTRNAPAPNTGTSPGNPRRYTNDITAYIDASAVYGSDLERANWLRSFEQGKLKVSAGDMLPYNTTTGEYADQLDLTAPHMANATGISVKGFVAGDPRAGENPLLAAFHTLFVREHNRQCDLLAVEHPNWTDEELYQHARKIIGGQLQAIVYEEWLPAMGVVLPPYTGYQANINPQMMNVFTAAAFRMGHTLLNTEILRLDNDGEVIYQGNMTLRDAFFNPFAIQETGSLDPFFKGIATQTQQEFDSKVIDDVRNFLFGEPGFGGLDLVSININRGRERGLPDFNTVRADFGLPRYNFFQQISPDASVFTRLLSTYVDINEIDPWVGMLAERPMPGTIFGQTVLEIMKQQFQNLRDGDRFYYEVDPILTAEEKQRIKTTTLRDIIMYNTDITLLQDNVFGALAHTDICDNMTLNLSGRVRTFSDVPLDEVRMELTSGSSLETQLTASGGQYTFSSMPFCDLNVLIPQKNDNYVEGVTTLDIITIQKHILGVEPFDSPVQWIAGDVNGSNTVSTLDLIRIRKLILGVETDFGAGTPSWRFVLGAYTFPDSVANPLTLDFPEWLDFQSMHAADYQSGFRAIKIGDVNGSVNPANAEGSDKSLVNV